MSIATIGRPREEFETPLTLPDWVLEPDYPHQMTKFGDLVPRLEF